MNRSQQRNPGVLIVTALVFMSVMSSIGSSICSMEEGGTRRVKQADGTYTTVRTCYGHMIGCIINSIICLFVMLRLFNVL